MNKFTQKVGRCFLAYSSLSIFLISYLIICISFVGIITRYNNSSTVSKVVDVDDFPVIIIDPGHGGNDGGAVSRNGVLEKTINMNIAEYICEFCKLSGVKCVLTRNSDYMLESEMNDSTSKKRSDLLARIEIASKYDNAYFVSIHQNYFPNSKYCGLQVFYSTNNHESRTIAEKIRLNNKRILAPENDRESKPAGREIFVLDSLDIPAVLVECGFLSNSEEANKLNTPEYQKEIAFIIYMSLIDTISSRSNEHI